MGRARVGDLCRKIGIEPPPRPITSTDPSAAPTFGPVMVLPQASTASPAIVAVYHDPSAPPATPSASPPRPPSDSSTSVSLKPPGLQSPNTMCRCTVCSTSGSGCNVHDSASISGTALCGSAGPTTMLSSSTWCPARGIITGTSTTVSALHRPGLLVALVFLEEERGRCTAFARRVGRAANRSASRAGMCCSTRVGQSSTTAPQGPSRHAATSCSSASDSAVAHQSSPPPPSCSAAAAALPRTAAGSSCDHVPLRRKRRRRPQQNRVSPLELLEDPSGSISLFGAGRVQLSDGQAADSAGGRFCGR